MKHIPSQLNLDPRYVTGICEIVGSFTFSRTMRNFAFYFAVKLPKFDEDLLYKIRDFFGVGTIYQVKPTTGSTNSAVYYRVTNINELMKIIDHFDAYPVQGKNLRRYLIWKEMVLLKQKYPKRKKLSFDDLNKLTYLAQELSGSPPHVRSDE